MATLSDQDGDRVTIFGGLGPNQLQDTWRLVERS